MESLPDDYSELQSLASDKGKEQVIGVGKDELIDWLKSNTDLEESEEDSSDTSTEETSEDEEETSDNSGQKIEENTIDLQKHIGDDEAEEDEDSEESSSDSSKDTVSQEDEAAEKLEDAFDGVDRKGLDEAVNNVWGRVWTLDKDPENPETENIRKNLSAMAGDVGLGENVKWWCEENLFTEDEQSPTQALMVSLVMASIVSLGMREDLLKQGIEKAKDRASQEEEDTEEKE